MSDRVTLTLRAPLDSPVDVEGLTPDRLASLGGAEIEALVVRQGARALRLGDVFRVDGERSARLRVVGALGMVHGIGEGTAGGELVVDGDAGDRVGAGMTGGSIEVLGSVGDDAGSAMAGGRLRVRGGAGDRLGAASAGASRGMTGGEIVVDGNAGADAAARARRGLVVVGGSAGERGARDIIAGSLVVLGDAAAGAGRGSKRGSVVVVGRAEVPATYRFACTYEPPHVRLTMTYLRRTYGLGIDDRVVAGRYRRWCGDAGDPGKGEILQWTGE